MTSLSHSARRPPSLPLLLLQLFLVLRGCRRAAVLSEAAAVENRAATLIREHWVAAAAFGAGGGRGGGGAARLAERLATALPPAYLLNPMLRDEMARETSLATAPPSLLDLAVEAQGRRRASAQLRSLSASRAEPRKDANEMSEQKVLDLGGGGVEPGTEAFDPISATAEPNKQCREKANKYRTECLFGTAFNNDAP